MRIQFSENTNAVEIVVNASGTMVGKGNGAVMFLPLPIARIPVGYGRTQEQAMKLAKDMEFTLPLEDHDDEQWKTWAAECGVRYLPGQS